MVFTNLKTRWLKAKIEKVRDWCLKPLSDIVGYDVLVLQWLKIVLVQLNSEQQKAKSLPQEGGNPDSQGTPSQGRSSQLDNFTEVCRVISGTLIFHQFLFVNYFMMCSFENLCHQFQWSPYRADQMCFLPYSSALFNHLPLVLGKTLNSSVVVPSTALNLCGAIEEMILWVLLQFAPLHRSAKLFCSIRLFIHLSDLTLVYILSCLRTARDNILRNIETIFCEAYSINDIYTDVHSSPECDPEHPYANDAKN